MEEIKYPFSAQETGVDTVSNLCAICGGRPHPIPQDDYPNSSLPGLLSLAPVNPVLRGHVTWTLWPAVLCAIGQRAH